MTVMFTMLMAARYMKASGKTAQMQLLGEGRKVYVHDYEIEFLGEGKDRTDPLSMQWPVGSPLPGFRVNFVDEHGLSLIHI